MILRCLTSSAPPGRLEQLELRSTSFFTFDAMQFRPRAISPIQARGVQPGVMAAIEGHENLYADAHALFRGGVAPGDNLTSCGLPHGVHLESPYIDKGARKSMLG